MFACLTNLSYLEELRLRSNDLSFFEPLVLNKFIFPFLTVKRLHLYLANLTIDKLCLLIDHLFPSTQELVIDVGQLSCNCESVPIIETNREDTNLCNEMKESNFCRNIKAMQICINCFPTILTNLKYSNLSTNQIKIYLYAGYKVERMFQDLQMKVYEIEIENEKKKLLKM